MTKDATMRKSLIAACLAFVGLVGGVPAQSAFAQSPVSICAESADHNNCANELTPKGISTGQESSHVIKATAGVLVGFQANNWSTTAGVTVMALDAITAPSNGTLAVCSGTPAQTRPCILKWYGIGAAASATSPGTLGVAWPAGPPLHFLNGLVLVCSSTGPTTLTLTETCTFSTEAL